MSTPAQPIFMLPSQVAELLHVSVSTLAYWRCLGGDQTPPFLKIGRRVLYAEHLVEEWALAQARKSTAEQWLIDQRRKLARTNPALTSHNEATVQ